MLILQSQLECTWLGCTLKDGHAHCTGSTSSKTGTVRGKERRPHFSLAIVSANIQLWTLVFLVISVYFNLRNILPKSGTFPRGTLCVCVCVCVCIYIYIYIYIVINWTLNEIRKWQDTGNSTGNTRSPSVKDSLWKSLWTCREGDYAVNVYDGKFKDMIRCSY